MCKTKKLCVKLRNDVTTLSIALCYACYEGRLDIVKWMIKFTSVNINFKWKFTPLGVACKMGHTEIVYLLLKSQNIDTNCLDARGLTPLLAVCRCKYSQNSMLKYLLTHVNELAVNISDKSGNTSLHYAIWVNKEESILHNACLKGDELTVIRLLRESSEAEKFVNSLDKFGNTPLHLACLERRVNIINILMYHGADETITNDRRETAEQIAGDKQIPRHLLNRIKSQNVQYLLQYLRNNVLLILTIFRLLKRIKLLNQWRRFAKIAFTASIIAKKQILRQYLRTNALFVLAIIRLQAWPTLRKLLHRLQNVVWMASINDSAVKLFTGNTSIHNVIWFIKEESKLHNACEMLCASSESEKFVNSLDSYGNIPLHLASYWHHINDIKILRYHGADETVTNNRRETAEQMFIGKKLQMCSMNKLLNHNVLFIRQYAQSNTLIIFTVIKLHKLRLRRQWRRLVKILFTASILANLQTYESTWNFLCNFLNRIIN